MSSKLQARSAKWWVARRMACLLTPQELAGRADVSAMSIYRLETSAGKRRINTLKALDAALTRAEQERQQLALEVPEPEQQPAKEPETVLSVMLDAKAAIAKILGVPISKVTLEWKITC